MNKPQISADARIEIPIVVFFIGLFLAGFISSCKKDEPCGVSVEGVLTDSITGLPVSGVKIILNAEGPSAFYPPSLLRLDETTSDAEGRYSLNGSVNCESDLWMGCLPYGKYAGSKKTYLQKGHNQIDFKLR